MEHIETKPTCNSFEATMVVKGTVSRESILGNTVCMGAYLPLLVPAVLLSDIEG